MYEKKFCPKPKVRTLIKNTSWAAWHEFCVTCIIYTSLWRTVNKNQTSHLRKKISKTKTSKGNFQKFSSTCLREASKTWCQATWFLLQNLLPPASFIVPLQVPNYKSLINWYSFNWSQKDERLSSFESGNLWVANWWTCENQSWKYKNDLLQNIKRGSRIMPYKINNLFHSSGKFE